MNRIGYVFFSCLLFQDFGRLLLESLAAKGVSSDDLDSWKGALAVLVNGISPKN